MGDPQALHAALLGATEQPKAGDQYTVEFLHAKVAALRAVVELHRPAPCTFSRCPSPETHRVCDACGQSTSWLDCATIRAVAGELGVDLNE